ncbi:MAG: lysostaphin resistance A-like protein [Planctomycetota bacterium]|jgi:membrane protease YdiL (CAAX protease family)
MNAHELFEKLGDTVTATDIFCIAGILFFGRWLLKTSFGRRALADSAPRRNSMPLYLPFIPLFIWFGLLGLTISITEKLLPDLADWQEVLLVNISLCASSITTMALIIVQVRFSFSRRLKGFGLNAKKIHKDFFTAVVNLLTVWPIVMFALVVTIYLGELIWGQDFQMQQHEELESIALHPQISVRLLIIVTAVVVVPVFEEMLFRGLFQTLFRSLTRRPWLSILMSSSLFATVHLNIEHWPALFVLAICMGYSYEKSGSLFRPIFIHSLFNIIAIISALNQ